MPGNSKIIVLDAMGVLYSVGDDVRDLLCPFIAEKGGCRDAEKVREIYIDASLGKMSNVEFWKAVDVNPALEDEYLRMHALTEGLLDFLGEMTHAKREIWCLSNDLSEWSRKLRARFRLEEYIAGFVISGDVGVRKPDPSIYHLFMKQSHRGQGEIIFVDDSPKNLDSAALLGIETILFKPASNHVTGTHKSAQTFREITAYLR